MSLLLFYYSDATLDSFANAEKLKHFIELSMNHPISDNSPTSKDQPQEMGKHWNVDRNQILAWLKKESPQHSELYEGCVRLLFENKLPGRGVFICHAIREIRNRLPHVLEKTKSFGRFDYSSAIDKISSAWVDQGMRIEKTKVDTKKDGAPDVQVNIPRPLFDQVLQLIEDHSSVNVKKLQTATLLFDGKNEDGSISSKRRPLIVQWVDITDWFSDQAHVDDKNSKTDVDFDWDAMEKKFEIFESSLLARSRYERFFEQKGALDAILENANRR